MPDIARIRHCQNQNSDIARICTNTRIFVILTVESILGGGGAASFLPVLPKMEKAGGIKATFMCGYFNFCKFLPMQPKIEKYKLFTIMYADILIFANFCQCCLKWKKLGEFRQHWNKMRLPPPPESVKY